MEPLTLPQLGSALHGVQALSMAPSCGPHICPCFAASAVQGHSGLCPSKQHALMVHREAGSHRPRASPGSCSALQGGKAKCTKVCQASEAGASAPTGVWDGAGRDAPAWEDEHGCCLHRLETAGPARALESAQQHGAGCRWENAVTVGPEATLGNVQAGVCFAKAMAALVTQQIQRGVKTPTRNSGPCHVSIVGVLCCLAVQAARFCSAEQRARPGTFM